MRKTILKTGVFMLLLIIVVSALRTTAADDLSYTVLAPLPGIGDTEGGKTTLKEYLPAIFKLAIGLAVVFAVLMVVIGGFQYMSSDALLKKEEGRNRIKNSLLGLVLVIGAWLILYTINPALLELKLEISPAEVKPMAGLGGEAFRATELQPAMQDALIGLVTACPGCRITSTTGGEHSVGSLHYQGLAVDIAPNTQLNQYLTGSVPPTACQRVSKILGGKTTTFLWEPAGSKCGGTAASTGDHWHMSVTP